MARGQNPEAQMQSVNSVLPVETFMVMSPMTPQTYSGDTYVAVFSARAQQDSRQGAMTKALDSSSIRVGYVVLPWSKPKPRYKESIVSKHTESEFFNTPLESISSDSDHQFLRSLTLALLN
ncbi:hypothetical protein M513_00140 [Trichuris suis]|uniref:Uncharacterized protein n=1 Tax=Trichuris suis TaxID=68888 RepID=A0A085MP31_9BILA|nr:hypothetical protein M513_00140 [Trichuris suis]